MMASDVVVRGRRCAGVNSLLSGGEFHLKATTEPCVGRVCCRLAGAADVNISGRWFATGITRDVYNGVDIVLGAVPGRQKARADLQ